MSKINGCLTCIELDANAKLGPEIIPGDPHCRTDNGELLLGIIERNNLTICNKSDKCTGLITRRRETVNGSEESIIDFCLVCEEINSYLENMIIDEQRKYALTKIKDSCKGYRIRSQSSHLFF